MSGLYVPERMERSPSSFIIIPPTRAGKNAEAFLNDAEEGFYIMVDGYKGYNKLKKARRCCCWSHIRRYLLQAIPKGHERDYSEPAVQGFMYCDKLFGYERSYKEKGLSFKQIYNRRLKDEKPVIEAFLAWADSIRKAVTASSRR